MKALSKDLRQRIANALRKGQNRRDIATRFEVSPASVYRIQQLDKKGDLSPKKRPGRTRTFSDEDLIALRALVEQQRRSGQEPDGATLKAAWLAQTGKTVGLSTLYRALRAAGLTYKKSVPWRASKTPKSAPPSEKP